MNSKSITIGFGGMCDPIADQIKKQGFKFQKEAVNNYQRVADALVRLRVGGWIPEVQIEKARKKLLKAICEHIDKVKK